MTDPEKFKKDMMDSMEKLKGATKGLDKFQGILETQLDLATPVSKKDVTVDGVNVFVSLTKDNRVVFTYPSADHAQVFYGRSDFNSIERTNKEWMAIVDEAEKINKDLDEIISSYENYLNLPWYKRIFTHPK